MSGIYIHIPFCRQKCHYCDFHSSASLSGLSTMLSAIEKELADRRDFLSEPVETLYIGGGTPSLCSADQLQALVNAVKRLWGVDTFRELTVEANPDDLTDSYVEALSRTDINRLSIGIQSFIDDHLTFMHRRHTADEAMQAVRRVKQAGIRNITIDLIYGIDSMTIDQWNYNIDRALELDVPHISAYHLTIEPRTVFGKRGVNAAIEEAGIEQYRILEQRLAEAGYVHYEVSNFARPGYEAVHNSAYWSGVPYLGVGPSAHSYDGHRRLWNAASNREYIAGTPSEEEVLSDVDRFNEYVMTSLRTARGADIEYIRQSFGDLRADYIASQAAKYVAAGSMSMSGSRLAIPTSGMLISDYIISDLFMV